MRLTPFCAILSGFAPDVAPGGILRFFSGPSHRRPEKNLTNHIQPPRAKVKKSKNKGRKADSAEMETAGEPMERLSLTDFFMDEQPHATLFSISQACFLNQSVLRSAIEPENATLQMRRVRLHAIAAVLHLDAAFILPFRLSCALLSSRASACSCGPFRENFSFEFRMIIYLYSCGEIRRSAKARRLRPNRRVRGRW